jgi:hypothetical protein
MPTKTINEKENKNLESQSEMREKKEKGDQDDRRLKNIKEKKKTKENHHLYIPVKRKQWLSDPF